MERVCKNCTTRLYGRADQKFCSDQCRNEFNNKRNGCTNNMVRRINGVLRKNRRILQVLNPNGRIKVHQSKMIELGFNFNYHTNTYVTKAGKTYFFCYDQGYLHLEDGYYALVIREQYIN